MMPECLYNGFIVLALGLKEVDTHFLKFYIKIYSSFLKLIWEKIYGKVGKDNKKYATNTTQKRFARGAP